jgi:hypothetical protein
MGTSPIRYRRELFLVTLILSAILLGYYWRTIFGDFALLPTDMIFGFPFFKSGAPADFETASNPLLSDPVLKFYPWHTLTKNAVLNGHFPFWNPYIFAGTPLFANAESAVLYPISFLSYILPLDRYFAVSAVIRLLIAGVGMYFFMRHLNAGWFGSIVAALAFTFSGSSTVWLGFPVSNTYVWMPLLFLFGAKLVSSQKLIFVPLISLTITVSIFGGHYQTAFMMFLMWGIFLFFSLADSYRADNDLAATAWVLGLLTVAVALGFMLAAVQLLPFWEWLQQTNETTLRLQERQFEWFTLASVKAAVVAGSTAIVPNIFGNPAWGSTTHFLFSNYIEQMIYIGILPLSLALLAVIVSLGQTDQEQLPLRRKWVWFYAVSGLVFLGIALRLPGLGLVNHLPVFNVVASNRYRLIYTFCATVLAGVGASTLLALPIKSKLLQWLNWTLNSMAGIVLIGLLAVGWFISTNPDVITQFNRWRVLYPIMKYAFSPANLDMYFPILVAFGIGAVLWGYRQQKLAPHWFRLTIIALILADLLFFGRLLNPSLPREQVFPPTESSQFLKNSLGPNDLARVVALNDDMPASTGTPYQLYDIAGTDFPYRRYLALSQVFGGVLSGHYRLLFREIHLPFLNLLGVKYVISSTNLDDLGVPPKQLKLVYQDSAVNIFENQVYFPRVFLVHQAKIMADDSQVLAYMASPTFDPKHEVVLVEGSAAPEISRVATTNSDNTERNVTIAEYAPQQVVVEVDTTQPGYLFMSDVYYPGWAATIDGQATELYQANFTFRAIYVPSGEHTVKFRYVPVGLQFGLGISGIGALVIIGLLGASAVAQGQRREVDEPHISL